MSQIKFTKGMFLITLILFLGILPAPSIAGFVMPWQYIFVPLMIIVFLLIITNQIKIPKIGKYFMIIWLVVIFEVFFSGIFSPLVTLGTFSFPRETIQYIARFLFFITFIIIFYNYSINIKKFIFIFVFVLLGGMMVGVLQFFNWGGSNLFREMYSFSEHHLQFMNREMFAQRRISGVAHFATATGGIASFSFIILMSIYLFYRKTYWITFIGITLIIFNIIASQSRMGYITLLFSIFVLYVIYNIIYKKSFKSTIKLATIISIFIGLIFWLYNMGNSFIVQAIFRWERLEQQVAEGGNRYGQVINATTHFDNWFHYLFGISRGVQNQVEKFYIEVEPVNIFVLYGSVGFILQYGLIAVLLVYFYKNLKIVCKEPILLTLVVASFVSLLSYQFFSISYYFFREVYVGLFPWILMGASIGAVERFKHHKNAPPTKRTFADSKF